MWNNQFFDVVLQIDTKYILKMSRSEYKKLHEFKLSFDKDI